MLTLTIEVDPVAEGWFATLHEPGLAGASSRPDAAAVAAMAQRIEGLLRPPLVIIPGQDAARSGAERAAGRELARVWAGPQQELRQELARKQAREAGTGVVVAISAENPEVTRLPWELLCWSRDGDAVQDGTGSTVVRLLRDPGPPPRPPGEDLRVLAWCPTPDDPECERALTALGALLGDALVHIGDGDLPPEKPGHAEVLHIICHGRILGREGELLTPDGPQHAADVRSRLAALLGRASGLVLQACAQGVQGQADVDTLARLFSASGARFCVAPAGLVGVEASNAFAGRFYRTLREGGDVAHAVADGRQAMLERRSPHPDERPLRMLAFASRADVLEGAPLVDGQVLPGWGRFGGELRALARRALRLARSNAHSWVGVEHLLMAMAQGEGSPASLNLLRRVGPEAERVWKALCAGIGTTERRSPAPSPRLARIAASLPDGAGLDALWQALVGDEHCGVHALSPVDLRNLMSAVDPQTERKLVAPAPIPAAGFQVIWGPEDGRTLWPAAGEVIGRHVAGGASACALYPDGDPTDRALSRQHLAYLGPGHLNARTPVRKLGAEAAPRELDGAVALAAGDLLQLGNCTWLRGLRGEKLSQSPSLEPLGSE